jgi:deazaflavin-dependent oxidoreductase (nitroreductase family)
MAANSSSDAGLVHKIPKAGWRLFKLPVRLVYKLGLGSLPGSFVLLLTTVGRKSGLPRVTPLQYSKVGGSFYVGSARGIKADWYCNILENPSVQVQVKSRRFKGIATPVTDLEQIVDFLEVRLSHHPRLVGAIFRAEGYPSKPSREQLKAYAAKRAVVVIHPIADIQA